MTEEQDNQVQQEINKAINFLGQNKFLEAENTCLKIIDSGDNADAYHILSSIKIYQQEFEDSIKYVKKSIAINVTIQSSKKTLNESDLEKINKLIIQTVENKTGAKIRS